MWGACCSIFSFLCSALLIIVCLLFLLSFFAPLMRGLLDTTLCDEVCQWLATGQLVSPGSPVSSINKTDRHNIAEIFLKMALSTITLTLTTFFFAMVLSMLLWFTASGYTFLYLQTFLSHFSWYQILSIENNFPHNAKISYSIVSLVLLISGIVVSPLDWTTLKKNNITSYLKAIKTN